MTAHLSPSPQIADFGMSRDLTNEYYFSQGGRIPLKWTAPEALLYHKYSTGSDVWSYGMVLFEIWSLGHKPFEEETAEQVGGAYSWDVIKHVHLCSVN